MGKAVQGSLLRMWEFLSDNIQNSLLLAVEKNRNAEKHLHGESVQSCPHCGGENTTDCSQIDGIADATVGLCLACGYLWCLECDSSLITGVICGHWQICSACKEKKGPSGRCGVIPLECPHIRNWLRKNHPVV